MIVDGRIRGSRSAVDQGIMEGRKGYGKENDCACVTLQPRTNGRLMWRCRVNYEQQREHGSHLDAKCKRFLRNRLIIWAADSQQTLSRISLQSMCEVLMIRYYRILNEGSVEPQEGLVGADWIHLEAPDKEEIGRASCRERV